MYTVHFFSKATCSGWYECSVKEECEHYFDAKAMADRFEAFDPATVTHGVMIRRHDGKMIRRSTNNQHERVSFVKFLYEGGY